MGTLAERRRAREDSTHMTPQQRVLLLRTLHRSNIAAWVAFALLVAIAALDGLGSEDFAVRSRNAKAGREYEMAVAKCDPKKDWTRRWCDEASAGAPVPEQFSWPRVADRAISKWWLVAVTAAVSALGLAFAGRWVAAGGESG
jgi:hypothetical protein